MNFSAQFFFHKTYPLDLQNLHPQPGANVSLISFHRSQESLFFSIRTGALRGKCCFCNFQQS